MLKRNIKITFRLNAKEQQQLKKNVKRTGLSQETYIRKLIEGYVPKELPPIDYHAMMRELNAIGNSMNQIAARANTTGFFTRIPLNSGISKGAMSQPADCDGFLADEYASYVHEFRKAVLEIQRAVTQPERI